MPSLKSALLAAVLAGSYLCHQAQAFLALPPRGVSHVGHVCAKGTWPRPPGQPRS